MKKYIQKLVKKLGEVPPTKIIGLTLGWLAVFGLGYFFGAHTFYMAADCHKDGSQSIFYPHYYNTAEVLNHEREYCKAWIELCHAYLYDENPAFNWEDKYATEESYEEERNNYWLDVVQESEYWFKIDSLNNHDWEDWYEDWRIPED